MASGNAVHNLRRVDWNQPDAAFDWARAFDGDVAEIMISLPADLPRVESHDEFSLAHPTPDHFIPLLYLAGLAAAAGDSTQVLVDGYAMGSLSMISYTLGCQDLAPEGEGGAPLLPDIPADETNI